LPDPTNGARTTDLDPLVNDTHFDSSRSVDFIALFDGQPFTMRCEPACYEVRCKGPRCAAGRWIFRDADPGKETAGVG